MSWLSKSYKKAENWVANRIPHQSAADRRAANQAVKEQIDFYQQQKATLEAESKRLEQERTAEKNKINQKQIRAARRAYRAPGFLEEANSDARETLG